MEPESVEKAGAELQGGGPEARSAAASLMGSVSSERKKEAAKKNAKMPRKHLADIACTCGRAGVLDDAGKPVHLTTCPRGRVIRLRLKKGIALT